MEITEKFLSRATTLGESPTATFLYSVWDVATPQDAEAAVMSAAPLSYINAELKQLKRLSIGLEPFSDGGYHATVQYGIKEDNEAGDWSYSFDTTGGSESITQSLETVQRYAPEGKTAPDHKGAIGVSKSGVSGTNIIVPKFQWSELHVFDPAAIDAAYKAAVYSLTGTTNDGTFRGFAAGEVLFLGASGSIDKSLLWKITFGFLAQPNLTGLTVGDIESIAKKGHEYLWVEYEETEDATANRLVQRPLAVHVERVYEEEDFAGLAIGTSA